MSELNVSSEFIPRITSRAGYALTQADWELLGVHTVAYDLDALLVKPGVDVLTQVASLAAYANWPGRCVVNASTLSIDVMGLHAVHSPFDGRVSRYSLATVLQLLVHLKPQVVIVPAPVLDAVCAVFPKNIAVYVVVDEALDIELTRDRVTGLVFKNVVDSAFNWHRMDKLRAEFPALAGYCVDDVDAVDSKRLMVAGIDWIESDKPANDALQGLVYTSDGVCSITAPVARTQFSALDALCACPTCISGFTWAYLHHLYFNTPGLCQRLLIQHNVRFVLDAINPSRL